MKPILGLAAVCIAASSLLAQEPMCATGERQNEILAYLQERAEHEPHDRARVLANPITLKDGTFYMGSDNGVLTGGHSNDLVGKTIEFQPVDASHYTLRHVAYAYVDPVTPPLRIFTGTGTHYVTYSPTSSTPITLFGNNVPTLYLSQFNGIHLKAPADITALQIDALHAFVQTDAVVSPLLITTAKPSRLSYPSVYVEEREFSLIVTWRSETGENFGYDVQARLFTDGRIQYSYRSARSMRWGAPILSAGIANVPASSFLSLNDTTNEIPTPTTAALKPMVDFANVTVSRMNDSDILRVDLKLAGPIVPSQMAASDFLRYIIVFGSTGSAFFDIKPDGSTQTATIGQSFVGNDNAASYSGDTVTFYVQQSTLPQQTGTMAFSAFARVGAIGNFDQLSTTFTLGAPPRNFVTHLAATADGTSLDLPISDPFTLPALDPGAAWTAIKARYPVTDNDVDGVAVYQTFYTDIIFYAGAYSANGNAGADGIAPASTTVGSAIPRRANVMHMNTLGYGWNATNQLSTHVILHEFGHRWLYFVRILENGAIKSSLNPVSAHPAQYIDTPAAFHVFGNDEASVMGGGVFTPNSNGTFHVKAANFGYSWTDLYLMGLADPAEAPPWFYINNSSPALGPEYYPPDDITVSGTRVNVGINQVTSALGARKPARADSPKSFRVLFVLVTDDGVEATPAEVASIKNIRNLFETNFHVATGLRAEVHTDFATTTPPRRRAARH